MSRIAFSIQYAGLTLALTKNERGEDVTPLKPISDLFGLKWEEQRKKVSPAGWIGRFLGTCTPAIRGAGDQMREQTCIRLDRVAAYLMSINPDRVRAAGNVEGADFLIAKQQEWADALHDYEQLGVAVNLNHDRVKAALFRHSLAFARIVATRDKTTDKADRAALGLLLAKLADNLDVSYQLELPQ